MNERDLRFLECVPLVDRLVKSLRIEEGLVADAQQAGYLAVIELLAEKTPDNWDAFKTGYVRPRVLREVLRHVQLARGPFWGVPLYELEAAAGDRDGDVADDDTSGTLDPALIVNDGNEDIDYEILYDRMLELILGLPKGNARSLMLAVAAGYSVSDAGKKLGLSQSSADRLYQGTVVELKEIAGNSPS